MWRECPSGAPRTARHKRTGAQQRGRRHGNSPSVLDITGSAELRTSRDTQFPMIWARVRGDRQVSTGATHGARRLPGGTARPGGLCTRRLLQRATHWSSNTRRSRYAHSRPCVCAPGKACSAWRRHSVRRHGVCAGGSVTAHTDSAFELPSEAASFKRTCLLIRQKRINTFNIPNSVFKANHCSRNILDLLLVCLTIIKF